MKIDASKISIFYRLVSASYNITLSEASIIDQYSRKKNIFQQPFSLVNQDQILQVV